ncbi:hypothetical protein [Tengunoibacter tsumagoiensis]|uniref:3-keto-disaccharide hydrolase domain-containing protein n=1 Tax=Tengunoibacter tsumagoiensis TaxID=2014871 RepID=A0A402A5A5_9CHLR|nr:hypothetical protein [Tengunoibacter tsumagoiensis]GCE14195.1 hypothetical protein KTT_40540 [Tengunoibacter tsumagoiensis]GCE14249.1 hypothetical protein KTT_41080 [Tengunoibacter tsumagoiensis]
MTIQASDTFARGNQSGWGTASDGETWTETGVGTLSISANSGLISSLATDTHVQLGSKTLTDQDVSARVAIANSGDVVGVQARFSAGGGNTTTYKFLYYGGGVHLNKANAGTNTQMTTATFTMVVATHYWMRLRCIGTSLYGRVWQDGTMEPTTWTTTTTDSSVLSGGFAVLANGNTASGISIDNFIADDLIVPVSSPQNTTVIATGRDGKTSATGRDGKATARGH